MVDGIAGQEERYTVRFDALYRHPSRRPPDFRSPNSDLTLRAMLSDKAIQALRPDESRSGTKHHAGDLDACFSHNDCSFSWSAGRLSYAYPKPIQPQEQRLREAQRAAIADGSATAKHGNPF